MWIRPHIRQLLLFVLPALAWTLPPASAKEPTTIASLLESLASGDATARQEAADALGDRYPEATAGVPILIDALDDDDASVRTSATETLTALGGRGLEPYRRLLKDAADPEQDLLHRILTGAGRSANPEPKVLCAVMTRGNEAPVRRVATLATALLHGTTPNAEPIFDVLIDLLNDDDGDVRTAAAAALSLRGLEAVASRPASAPSAEALAAISSESPGVRFAGVRLLQISGATGPKSEDVLGKAVGDDSALVRVAACEALLRLGHAASATGTALEAAMREDGEGRYVAAEAMVQAGRKSRLAALLGDEDEGVRRAAAHALASAGAKNDAVVRLLHEWLDEERSAGTGWCFLWEVTAALARVGRAAAATEPALRDVLAHGTAACRVAVARALLEVAPPGDGAVEMLGTVIERTKEYRPDPQDLRAALDLLIELGPRAEPVLPTLITYLQYRDSDVDRQKGRVLDRLLVRSHAFDQLRRIKLRVVEILRNLGPAAAPAKDRLTRLLTSSDLRLRYRAGRALRSMGSDG